MKTIIAFLMISCAIYSELSAADSSGLRIYAYLDGWRRNGDGGASGDMTKTRVDLVLKNVGAEPLKVVTMGFGTGMRLSIGSGGAERVMLLLGFFGKKRYGEVSKPSCFVFAPIVLGPGESYIMEVYYNFGGKSTIEELRLMYEVSEEIGKALGCWSGRIEVDVIDGSEPTTNQRRYDPE